MFRAANRAALRLWKDESGVVLAITVIVFLTLFMMASAVFTAGESIRLRVELQNAADAAAYSAAIVQADCNSRVAAINRAMSWTYVQMVRMEMDYIVDKWLERVLKNFDANNKAMRLFNFPSPCLTHRGVPWYVAGYNVNIGSSANHEVIRLNQHLMVKRDDIEQARKQADIDVKSYPKLREPIKKCRENIDAMNAKERELITKRKDRIRKTVESILKADLIDTWNDQFAGGANLAYVLRQEEQPLDNYFEVLKQDKEDDFLRHSSYIPEQGRTPEEVFGPGSEQGYWFVATGQQQGIQRGYKQRLNVLIAEWHYASSFWIIVKGKCVKTIELPRMSNSVKGQEVRDENFETAIAEPRVLKKVFFSKPGSLVVGVTRRLNNPLQFMLDAGGPGIFRPFTLDNGNRYMWTVSAARAAYNPKPWQKPDCGGEYEETWFDKTHTDDLWNLKTGDWDAALLPLHRAWAQGENRKWDDSTAGRILNDVKNGPWQPLYGGGGALGAQGGPEGMQVGAAVSYGAAEGLAVH